MLWRPGHFLVWTLLPARWMTLHLDCDTITTNQRLERDQKANQLLERIGPHYRAQPITYLAQLCRLYLVYFSLFISYLSSSMLASFSSHTFISVLCLSFFFLEEEEDEIPAKKETEDKTLGQVLL